jgi:hypothetical protein
MKFTREESLQQLQNCIENGEPIIGAGAGTSISAKFAERGGVDLVFAGILAGFVPDSVWTTLFANEILGLPAFVVWTTILGAVIGIITFGCSVGNVPFATVLWTEGLSFAGVSSYIYADLIIPPLMDAYRGYYGGTNPSPANTA